jgi:hypothetical protein
MSDDALHRADRDIAASNGSDAARGGGQSMNLRYAARAAYRVFTAPKVGPSLYDVCDELLLRSSTGNAHLRKFYKKALANPPLRLILRRAGHPQLRDETRLAALRDAVAAARDQEAPDWSAIGRPVAALLDEISPRHPKPKRTATPARIVSVKEVDGIIRACARHLLASYARHGFIPCYAAFNLIGDPDFRGRDLLAALRGLNARTYKNSTFLFNLARVFIANAPAAALINPPWTGIAEPMWEPVQIRHRSAYYDAFFAEALMDFRATGLATPEQDKTTQRTIESLIDFCLRVSRERVRTPDDGRPFDVVTALVPPPHSRFSPFFARIKSDLGFETYVADCDTTSCSFSAATQFGSQDPILDQPMIDFYAAHQVRAGVGNSPVTVPLNDNIDYEGGIVTWIDNLAGDRPFGNDLDPTLNLDILEVSFRNFARWKILETPSRLATVHRIIGFQKRLAASGAVTEPRSHIYYLPELYCAYFGRCYAAFMALPPAAQRAIDPDGAFDFIRTKVLAYVQTELIAGEMNVFDAALALIALGHLGAEPATFTPALHCIVGHLGEGGRHGPYKAYEWNKMKTPTRILVGGPEVTSAFVLMGLALARRAMMQGRVSMISR